MLLKILNRTHDCELTTFAGLSPYSNYEFRWREDLQTYVYSPSSQEEIDDIFGLAKFKQFPYIFSAVFNGVTTTGSNGIQQVESRAPSIRPYVKPENYAEFPAVDLLGLSRDLGFEPQGDHANCDNLKRQIHAYCMGRAWAIEEHKQLQARIAEMERKVRESEVRLAVFSVPAIEPPASQPAPPAPSVPVRRKPGPKPGSKRRSYAEPQPA